MSSPSPATRADSILLLDGARGAPTPIRRLLALLRPDQGDVWAVVVFSLVVGALMLATPVAVQTLVNFVAFGASVPPLLVLSLLLLLGLGAAALVSALKSWIVEALQRRIFVRVVSDLCRRLPRMASTGSEPLYAPELVNRFFDVMTVQKAGSLLLLEGLGNVIGIVVGLVVLAFYHPLLLAFDLVLLLAVFLVVFGPLRLGVRTAIRESKAKYAVAGWLEELTRNPLAFRFGGAQSYVDVRSEQLALEYVASRRAHYRVVFGQILSALGLQVIASTALLAIGGFLVIRGELTLGQLVASELIVTVIVQSVAKMGKHIEGFYDLAAAVDKLGQLIDVELEPRRGDALPPNEAPAAIELRNVSVSFGAERRVLRDVSMVVPAGGSLAIEGPSGSGRSLVLELLYGLRKPESGSVALDGIDYRELRLDALRRDVAIASNVEIFDGTVLENVTLGRSGLRSDSVTQVLRELDLLDVLRRLPDGLQTRLSPGGVPLTDGQKRRLMVARAVVGAPRLLLVDNLLDSLSTAGREATLRTLFRTGRTWTLVIVTDRDDVQARCSHTLDLTPAQRTVEALPRQEG